MKKVLLLSLSLVLALGAFAQEKAALTRLSKKDAKVASIERDARRTTIGREAATPSAAAYAPQTAQSVVTTKDGEYEEIETMTTYYDLQSNSWCSSRMIQLDNGDVAVVATFSQDSDNPGGSDRGTGYNIFNAEESIWGDLPEERVEDFRTGWPAIARWGETGEVLISHTPLYCFTREVAGEGEWEYKSSLTGLNPDDYEYDEDVAWPRVATSGENHEIIHMIGCLQHGFNYHALTGEYDSVWNHMVYYRSLDGGESWEVGYSPLQDSGEDLYKGYGGDSYNISANGHTVAIVYSGSTDMNTVMYKSTDDGETWTKTIIWANPMYGHDFSTDSACLTLDSVGVNTPDEVGLAIDNNGVVHVVMSIYSWTKYALGNSYYPAYGLSVDGIYYWNDTKEAPVQSLTDDPRQAFELWPWVDDPEEEGGGYYHRDGDSTCWAGFMPRLDVVETGTSSFSYANMFTDYHSIMRTCNSAHPALSIDEYGNMACAWSAPCATCLSSDNYYLRKIFASFYNVDEGYWRNGEEHFIDVTDEELYPGVTSAESIYTFAVENVAHPGEFWFGCQTDYTIGLYMGSEGTQASATENSINVFKVVAEEGYASVPESTVAQDVVYSIYPNPATDNYIVVKSAQKTDATITFVNLVGQTVAKFNQKLELGANTIGINLKSGVYFCTISANGFDKTVKFVVK